MGRAEELIEDLKEKVFPTMEIYFLSHQQQLASP